MSIVQSYKEALNQIVTLAFDKASYADIYHTAALALSRADTILFIQGQVMELIQAEKYEEAKQRLLAARAEFGDWDELAYVTALVDANLTQKPKPRSEE